MAVCRDQQSFGEDNDRQHLALRMCSSTAHYHVQAHSRLPSSHDSPVGRRGFFQDPKPSECCSIGLNRRTDHGLNALQDACVLTDCMTRTS